MSHFAVHVEHCKSTILQLKKWRIKIFKLKKDVILKISGYTSVVSLWELTNLYAYTQEKGFFLNAQTNKKNKCTNNNKIKYCFPSPLSSG